ncbi:MAG: hypothetical protein JW807_17140 [Spirochaetes bacterium]|nr:hypothetical protein [Spirochaetota bacterium]
MAMKDGVNVEEVLTILNMDLKESNKCTEDEKTALLFAQNYAENFNTPVQNFLLARALLM